MYIPLSWKLDEAVARSVDSSSQILIIEEISICGVLKVLHMGLKGKIAGNVGRYPSDPANKYIVEYSKDSSKSQSQPQASANRGTQRKFKPENDSRGSRLTGLLLSFLSSSPNRPRRKPSAECTETEFPQTICTDASVLPEWEQQGATSNQYFGNNGSEINVITSHEKQPETLSSLTHAPLSEESLILSEALREYIYSALPNIIKGRHWIMLYSTAKHGISLQTLYRKSSALSEPFLLVVSDFHGVTFGGLITAPLEPATKPKYSGTNEMFVFTNIHENPQIFKATGINRYFILCTNNAIFFGGGGYSALHLDEDLLHGSSGACETFGNHCLASSTDFSIANVEVWGFSHVTKCA